MHRVRGRFFGRLRGDPTRPNEVKPSQSNTMGLNMSMSLSFRHRLPCSVCESTRRELAASSKYRKCD